MADTYIRRVFGQRKRIALIAHDNMKQDLIDWCRKNKEILIEHDLCGTGTTARLVSEKAGLGVYGYNSGPLGGDQQIGARIVAGEIDIIIFFADPLTAQPHDPDVKALMRIAQVYDIPMAVNKSTADYIIKSELFNSSYVNEVRDYSSAARSRKLDIDTK